MNYVMLFLVLCLAVDVRAADVECQVPIKEADPTVLYDATTGIRLCAPTLDDTGEPLEAGELTMCVVTLGGLVYAQSSALPGEYIVFAPPISGAKRRTLAAYCVGVVGQGPATPSYDAVVRRARPGKPAVR